jgi:electron transport complex protein RnfD
MASNRMFIVSHAPFWHNGSGIARRNFAMIVATLPALALGVIQYGLPAVGVVTLAVSTAMFWEWLLCKATRRPVTLGDGNAALLGLVLAMLAPATVPWWAVLTGTFLTIVIGQQIFGGIGSNPYHPVALAMLILTLSWTTLFDFSAALVNYDLDFKAIYPLTMAKAFGNAGAEQFTSLDLLLGLQIGGLGATFGLGLIAGGIYLMIRRIIRWEIAITFLAGIFVTALCFHTVDPSRFAGPVFHLLTGYTLVGAFFLLPEDSSSPVNTIPMFIYGFAGGVMTILIRNIGNWVDGVLLAVMLMNLLNPLLDKIRPKVLGKVG